MLIIFYHFLNIYLLLTSSHHCQTLLFVVLWSSGSSPVPHSSPLKRKTGKNKRIEKKIRKTMLILLFFCLQHKITVLKSSQEERVKEDCQKHDELERNQHIFQLLLMRLKRNTLQIKKKQKGEAVRPLASQERTKNSGHKTSDQTCELDQTSEIDQTSGCDQTFAQVCRLSLRNPVEIPFVFSRSQFSTKRTNDLVDVERKMILVQGQAFFLRDTTDISLWFTP